MSELIITKRTREMIAQKDGNKKKKPALVLCHVQSYHNRRKKINEK